MWRFAAKLETIGKTETSIYILQLKTFKKQYEIMVVARYRKKVGELHSEEVADKIGALAWGVLLIVGLLFHGGLWAEANFFNFTILH